MFNVCCINVKIQYCGVILSPEKCNLLSFDIDLMRVFVRFQGMMNLLQNKKNFSSKGRLLVSNSILIIQKK